MLDTSAGPHPSGPFSWVCTQVAYLLALLEDRLPECFTAPLLMVGGVALAATLYKFAVVAKYMPPVVQTLLAVSWEVILVALAIKHTVDAGEAATCPTLDLHPVPGALVQFTCFVYSIVFYPVASVHTGDPSPAYLTACALATIVLYPVSTRTCTCHAFQAWPCTMTTLLVMLYSATGYCVAQVRHAGDLQPAPHTEGILPATPSNHVRLRATAGSPCVCVHECDTSTHVRVHPRVSAASCS